MLAMMDSHLPGKNGEAATNAAPMTLSDLFGGLLPDSVDDTADVSTESIAKVLSVLPSPLADVSSERIEQVVAEAGRAPGLIERYEPAQFAGDLLYFTAGLDDTSGAVGATGWDAFVAGTVDNHVVDATHWSMASPDALAVIADILDARTSSDQSPAEGDVT
jgi:thioesterase domain-containing protein